MRCIRIISLLLLCLTFLTSCNNHDDKDALWIPINGISWGMEKGKVESLLKDSGVVLNQENGTVPNRYILSEAQTCWGFIGIVKLDFKSFTKDGDAYLTAFSFYPKEADEDAFLKELSDAFGVKSSNSPGNKTENLQWESKTAITDISDKDVRQRAKDLTEMIWGNTPFKETVTEISRPLVTAQYTPMEQGDSKSSIYLSGEHAALAAIAKDKQLSSMIIESSDN